MAFSDQPAEEKQQREPQHIFVVNHEPDILDVVRMLLEDETYRVTTTNYLPRMWTLIAALQPALLLIDLSPRSAAGMELLERLQQEGVTNRIPVVVTSTDPCILARVEREQERFGGDRLVAMPFDVDVLLAAIRDLIGPA